MLYAEMKQEDRAFHVDLDRASVARDRAAAAAVFARHRAAGSAFRYAVPETADEAARRLEYVREDVRPRDGCEPDPLAPLVDELKACAKALRSKKPQPALASRLWELSARADRLAGEEANAAVLIWNTVRGATKPRAISG